MFYVVKFSGEGKWLRNIDYYRLDGSTTAQSRKKWAEEFNDETNVRWEKCSIWTIFLIVKDLHTIKFTF